MKNKRNNFNFNIPSWISFIYTSFALLLVPWTIYLAYSLPRRQVQHHWDITWVGLDIGIILLLLLTGFYASIRSRMLIISLSAATSFLVVDTWFDLVSSRPGSQLIEAIILAIFIELPLIFLGYYLCYKIISNNFK